MTEDAIKYAEAQLMCATVCERYGLSPESTAMALDVATERFHGAHACYKALLNSLTWEKVPASDIQAVSEAQRPISQQFTLWFDGPRALDAFRACEQALSPCSYKAVQIGSHTKVSFDAIS